MSAQITRIALAIIFPVLLASPALALSEKQIRSKIIEQSINTYPGNCPCPYNTDSAGRSCGKRSAYSRAGGYDVVCYPSDVTTEMMATFKKEAR